MDSVLKAISSLQPMHSVAGFIVGTLIGLTGVGGGSLMTPLLILLFGLHPSTAVGTDLLFAATTKSAGTLVHGINQTIDWRVVGRLAIGSAPATVMSMACLSYIDISSSIAKEIITAVLSIALLVTAVLLTSRRWIIKRYASQVGNLTRSCTAILTIAVGAVLGVLVSISSVGAGAIGMTALVLLYPQLPTPRLVGSDIAHAVPLTFVAGMLHWVLGSADLHVFASLILGSVPGILIGSYFVARIPEPALRLALAIILVIVATKLALGIDARIRSHPQQLSFTSLTFSRLSRSPALLSSRSEFHPKLLSGLYCQFA
jgi:uncharacterized protein